jgi:hypothetical protein
MSKTSICSSVVLATAILGSAIAAFSAQAQESAPGNTLPQSQAPAGGSWTKLNHASGVSPSNPLLLTDGRVLIHVACTANWYALTPDNTGSYVNGTWAQVASLPGNYTPRAFGSGVLPDGRVVIEGGEYSADCTTQVQTAMGAIYDPVANSWTAIAPPSGWAKIGDGAGIVLPNGTYMQTSCCDQPPHAALLNPSTLTWTSTGAGKFDVYDEEAMALLHDGTVLTVDAYSGTGTCGTGSERYDPSTGAWSNAGSTIVQQADCSGIRTFEVGPIVMRPDGTAVSFGGVTTGTAQTAIYTVSSHSWAAGPVQPSVGGVPYGRRSSRCAAERQCARGDEPQQLDKPRPVPVTNPFLRAGYQLEYVHAGGG